MSSKTSKLLRVTLAAAIAVSGAVVATTVTTTTATAAQASSVGGQITRAEIIERAQFWYNKSLVYSQGGSALDSSGRSYRTDCSGYVSMAWHLGSSPNTQGLVDGGFTREISRSDLKAGDVLNSYYNHVLLFEKWDDAAHTKFSYYSFGSTPVKHITGVSIDAARIDGHPNGEYKALRYKNVVEDSTPIPAPAPAWKPAVGDGGSVTGADGTAYTFSRSANGHVQMTARLAGGGWTTADLTNVVGTPAAAGGSPAAFVQTNGTVGVVTANADNGHLQITYRSAAGTWATSDLTNTVGTPTTGGAVSASTDPDGTLAIYSRGSVNGNHLSLTALQPNGAWATVDLTNTVGTPASAGGAPSTFTQTNGTVGVATANADNGHLQITYKSAAGTWATSDLTGTAGTPVTDGAVSASTDPDGTLAIYSRGSVNGNHLSLTALQPSGAWATVDLTNTVGTPASAGGAPSTFTQTNGTVGVATANADNGHLQITYKSAAGTWATTDLNTLVGTPATDGAVSASTDPDGTLAIYSRGSLNGGHLNLTALQPNGAWATVDLTNTVGTPAS
ncbi:hypothetical protein [Kitasatospora sp. NPDC051705]|uniref:hypothetical protein n=1 Tax=Kitasatospora sp. NPDC051705 TaxID=3364057 RepID=UPI0037AD8428